MQPPWPIQILLIVLTFVEHMLPAVVDDLVLKPFLFRATSTILRQCRCRLSPCRLQSCIYKRYPFVPSSTCVFVFLQIFGFGSCEPVTHMILIYPWLTSPLKLIVFCSLARPLDGNTAGEGEEEAAEREVEKFVAHVPVPTAEVGVIRRIS